MSRTVIGYLLGAFLIAGAVWFYLNFERVSEREHVGLQGEAARNPLLALTRLIERMGGEARSARRVEELDQVEPGATVILQTGREGYSSAQLERLVEWVGQGGHLVVEAEDVATPDALLDALKVARQKGPMGYREKPAEVHLPGAKALRVELMRPMELVDHEAQRTRHVSKDGHGTHVLHFGYGGGRVTVLPSLAFMTNVAIGENDHAELAWRLLQIAPRTALVVIAPRLGRPSLREWLAREARPPLMATAALLLLWGWRAAARFGPVEPEPPRERRRLLDHLQASGRFLWRAGEASRLLSAARETCLHKISRTRPGLVELPPAERAGRLAVLTGLPQRDIELAWSDEPATPAAFTAAVRTLQQIEEQLTRKVTA
jgi:hypothetical protein